MPASSTSKAIRRRDETIIGLIERLSRERDLSPEETALMERTVRRVTPKRSVWRWSADDDRKLIAMLRKRPLGARYSAYGKPFQRDDRVRKLAEELGRTEWAVYRRLERLRKLRKCSKAGGKRKG